MPKTTTKKTTKKSGFVEKSKRGTREVRFPPELHKMMQQLFDAMAKGGLKGGTKMARIKCPECEGINLGVAWSKATGWMVLCDECHVCEKLDNIQPLDPETCEVGSEQRIPLKSEAKVN